MKRMYVRVLCLAGILLLFISLWGCGVNVEKQIEIQAVKSSDTESVSKEYELAEDSDIMEVHFIDVGQGDSTLITNGRHAMLIDAGDNSRGTAIQLYLDKLGIDSLDYVIGTHPDADHIGGLDVIIYKKDCGMVIMPDSSKDTLTYEEVVEAAVSRHYKITVPAVGQTYQLGNADFTVVAPNTNYENSNDNSVGILLQHGEKRFLFTGDSEEASETDMLSNGLDISADVLKVPHHGSKNAVLDPFLDAVSPVYSVISCGEGNTYGHPHAEAMNKFRIRGVNVFRTDEQGTIIAVSDGVSIKWNCPPTESWAAGEPIGATFSTFDSVTYIVNTNTKKFHLPDCSSVDDMADKNRAETTDNKEELISKGYSPCMRCLKNE